MPKSTILLMRHPQTRANVNHLFSGNADVFLTERGEQQRRQAARALIAFKPDRLLSSPLTRCVSIAAEAAEYLDVETVIDERLTEIDFGVLEGTDYREAIKKGIYPWPADEHGHSVAVEGGETYEHAIERAREIMDLLKTFEGRTAIVSHGGFASSFFCAAFGGNYVDFSYLKVSNVSSQVFTCDGEKFDLVAFGLRPGEVVRRCELEEDGVEGVWGD